MRCIHLRGGNPQHIDTMTQLVRAVRSNAQVLMELEVSVWSSDQRLKEISAVLPRLAALRTLKLANVFLASRAIVVPYLAAPHLRVLELVHLRGAPEIEALGAALDRLPSLRVLAVLYVDEGVAAKLCRVLRRPHGITELAVDSTVCAGIEFWDGLTSLTVNETFTSLQRALQPLLKRRLPHLTWLTLSSGGLLMARDCDTVLDTLLAVATTHSTLQQISGGFLPYSLSDKKKALLDRLARNRANAGMLVLVICMHRCRKLFLPTELLRMVYLEYI